MPTSPSVSVDQCLHHAQEALAEYPPNIDSALTWFETGLKIDETNEEILDQFAEMCADIGDNEKATSLFNQLIAINPRRARPWFYLGQMLNGLEALAAYEQCIALTRVSMNDEESEQLVSCLCLIAELYMTDLCDEDQAESTCEESLNEAISINPFSFEALTSLSTFRKIRMEIDESKNSALRAVAIVDAFVQQGLEVDVPFSNRMRLAENLVDLELIEEALLILSTLLDEDEEDVQAWFLTAACHYVAKEKEEAKECVMQGKKVLKKNQLPENLKMHWTDNFSNILERIATL